MAHLFNSGRRCVPSLGSLALASVRHAPAIYRTYVALTAVKGILEKAIRDVRRNREAFDKANQEPLGSARRQLQDLAKQQSDEGKTKEASASLQQIETLQADVMRLAEAPEPVPPSPGKPFPPPPDKNILVFNGHRYKLVMDNLSWGEAKKRCEDMGGHLLVIDGRDENTFIMNALQEFKEQNKEISDSGGCVWLGVLRNDPKGQWVTVAGTPQIFSAWRATGWPKDGHTRGRISIHLLEWVSSTGSGEKAPHYFICEWDR